MANRSYLFSLSNRPTSFEDRPETIGGLSEWAYDVPFIYRLLMSGDPQLCASLVSDGLGDEEPGSKTQLHAISSPFDPGFARVQRFAVIARHAASLVAADAAAPAAVEPASFGARLKRFFSGSAPSAVTDAAPAAPPPAPMHHLLRWLDEMVVFLDDNRDDYLLLETVELDIMSEGEEGALRACVEAEIARCRQAGAAFEALPADELEAARVLRRTAAEQADAPLDAFFGLRFDDDRDSTRSGATKRPLGVSSWTDVLYFDLSNREEFEARRAADA